MKKTGLFLFLTSLICLSGPVFAQDSSVQTSFPGEEKVAEGTQSPDSVPSADNIVLPTPAQLGLMPAASSRMERIHDFHNGIILWIITGIVIFVMALLLYVILRFNRKAHPQPSRTTHNVLIEILWTAVPVLLLLIIAIPSFKMLYYLERVENPEMTVKVTGYQWYWGYDYINDETGEVDFGFLSYMIPEDEVDETQGQVRLLSTDNPVVLPIDTNIRFIVTAGDVLHSFTVPPFGFKKDAVPGRLNETWVRIDKPGTYFGQCSEICGTNHAYMPIEIRAVTKEEYQQWLETAREEFASLPADNAYKIAAALPAAY
jgi:cytochrome c oxidase subunit 2